MSMLCHFAEVLNLPGSALAWVPFRDPMPVYNWWYFLLIPLALGISLVYKALRVHDLRSLWVQTLVMTLQVVLGMVALAIVLVLLVEFAIPMLPVQ